MTSGLQSAVQQIGRRLVRVEGGAATAWGAAAFVGVMLVAVWLDLLWELSPAARTAAPFFALLVVGAVGGWLAMKISAALRPPALARRLDSAAGGGGEILSGWELETRQFAAPQQEAGLTEGLATLAVGRATNVAGAKPPAEVVPLQPLQRAGGVLGGILAAILLLSFVLPSLARTEWSRFLDPYGDTPPYSGVDFVIEPGNTQVVYGRGLEITATITGAPLERVELMLLAEGKTEALPMFPDAENRWRAVVARITAPTQYFVRADRARSHKYQIEVLTAPELESVRFRVTPPAYTQDPVYQGPLPPNGLTGLAGTKVQITAKSNRPLRSGVVRLELNKETLDVSLSPLQTDADEVSGEFTLTAAGKFSLEIVDTAGQPSQAPFGGSITLLQDQRPFVRILEPQSQSFATPTAVLPIQFTAEDDYGVARLQLYRSLNDSQPRPLEVATASPPRRRLHSGAKLTLADYGLEPGDEIKLFARVEDNDPAGAKGAESAVITIRIIPQEEFEKMLRFRQGLDVLVSKYEQARRRLESLSEKMEELQKELAKQPEDSPAAEELKQKIADLAAEMRREAEQIETSAKHLLPYDIDEKLSKELTKLADAVREAAEATEKLSKKDGLKNGEANKELAELLRKLKADRGEFDKQALEPLEHLAKVFPLLENQSRFLILVARQTDLADRIAALKGKDGQDNPANKVRLREWEDEQKANRKELFDLLKDIAENANKLPDEPAFKKLRDTAWKFVEDVQASGAAEVMGEAEVALAEFLPTHAHKKAAEAAEILRTFIKRCEGLGADCEGSLAFQPSLSECLGDSLAQMLAEAGLGMGKGNGSGLGSGSGNGFSAQRGGRNIGLYGGLPGMSSLPSGSAGNGNRGADSPSRGGGGKSSASDDPTVERSGDSDDGSSIAAGQATAPPRYRRRVGKYLQRIAEESEAP